MNRTRICFAVMLLAVGSLFAQPERTPDPAQAGAMAKKYYREHLSPGNAGPGGGGNEIDAMRGTFLPSPGTGQNFGYSVACAGDVNGDGYPDIIVGADAYSSYTGRAYIYFGGPAMNNTPDVILTGETTNSLFGYSVSAAGDVNGDGYADVIVGAYSYSSATGRAYIYFGGTTMNNVPDVIVDGETGSSFGISVSTAGDVNGDGYADVIVGAKAYSSNTGRAYVYFGGASMNNVADVIMTGTAPGDYFGASASTAGDVNGDGYADVIVGAYGYSSFTGRSYIYFGGAAMNNIADVVLTGASAGDAFGNSASTAGDVNGDGYADVIVGAPSANAYAGRAYIYLGGPAMNNVADVILTGEGTSSNFGWSVSTVGDVNGDGYADVIVGAYGYSSSAGRAYVYFGGAVMNNAADAVMTGEAASNSFGYSVSAAGDVNGDGYADIIVGAYGYSGFAGRAYVYFNSLTGTDLPDYALTGEATNNYFGWSVSTAGDVNGDGYADVIVGAAQYAGNTGRAYIFFGGPIMDDIPDVIMTGEATGDHFGISVSTAGDVNGDGYADVIVATKSAAVTPRY